MEDLASTAWFSTLPGTARRIVVDKLAEDLARESFWSMLSESIWGRNCERVVLGAGLSPENLDHLMGKWALVPKETKVPTQVRAEAAGPPCLVPPSPPPFPHAHVVGCGRRP